MNNVPFVPRSLAGRKIHNLARRHVRDDHDLRAAVHRALAERRGSTGPVTDDWTRPALDTRRRVTPPTPADQESDATMQPINGTPADVPTPLHERRWPREALKFVAAAIAIAIIGTLLVLLLRDTDPNDQSSVPGVAGPEATATTQASPTIDATAARQATRQTAQQVLTATAASDDAIAAATATAFARLPMPGEVVATIPVGNDPQAIATTDGTLWIANSGDGTVSRIDPATNEVVATVTIGSIGGEYGSPKYIAAHNGQIWATNDAEGTVVRIDPATNQVVQTISVPLRGFGRFFHGLMVDDSGLWISDGETDVLHIDPQTGALLATIPVLGSNVIAAGFGSVWVVAEYDSAVMRIDPTSNQILNEITLDASRPLFVATGAGAVWVSDYDAQTITRIDPATNTIVAKIETGLESTHAIYAASGGVWVSAIISAGVVMIDPATNQSSGAVDTDHGGSWGSAELDGSIWVLHGEDNVVTRIDKMP